MRFTWIVSTVIAALASGCGDDAGDGGDPGDGGCRTVAEADLECTPVYDPPTFMAIYDNIFEKRCGTMGTGCHSPDGASAGLVLYEPEDAYAHLIGDADGRARIVPGHPECSELMRRVESSDLDVRMPLGGSALDAGAICAMRLWIAAGAEGP